MNIFIVTCFVCWRILLFLNSYAGSVLLPFQPRFPYSDIYLIPSGLPSWIWSFANFDGVHYLTIARQGYSAQFTQVFFPVFPLVLSLFEKIFHFLPSLWVSLTFSNLLFLVSLFVFKKLLALDYRRQDFKWILVFLLLFPTSFYFGSLYTEGLFLLFVFSSLLLARKKNWLLSSLFAALASATRFVGIFLLPALLYEWYLSKKKNIIYSPVLYIAPLGLVAYMIYLQISFADALYFWHAQPVFGAFRSGTGIILLPQVFWRYYKILTTVSVQSLAFWIPLSELVSILFAIASLILAHHKNVRLSYLIYSWPSLILPTLTGTLSSMPRYILIIFPIFIVFGLIKSKVVKYLLLTSFFILLVIYTILFTRGFWVS